MVKNQSPTQPPQKTGKPVILVVDDQPQNVELLEAYLIPNGYEIIKAANGEEALEKLSVNQIELILLDVMMPGIDGFEVTRRIRADEKIHLLPIILVTSLNKAEDRVKGIEAGCEDFISKPVDKMELLARVQSLLKIKAYNDLMSNYQKELEIAKQSESEAREYCESIINTVREPLIALDQDLRVVSTSRSFYEFFKVTPEETVGRLIYDLGNKQWNIPKLRELLETILLHKTTFDNYEVEHHFTTIGRRIMLLNARQIERGKGKGRIILLAFEDITDRRQAEDKLKKTAIELARSNEELEAFSYSISHDLRAPLRAMDGFSEEVLQNYGEKLDGQGRDYLNRIRIASQTMSQLIDDILKLSRITRADIHFDKVNISGLVNTIGSEIKIAHPERQVIFVIQPEIEAYGDSNLLNIALTNLIENSWKFTIKNSQARIEFGVTREDGKPVYFVKDNGVGFDMKYADKLFQPFRRLHTDREFPGTGIGLATVQRIIQRHGGRIWAESEPGKGTTLFFNLGGE
jgi:PAS domain S-box-containing protein